MKKFYQILLGSIIVLCHASVVLADPPVALIGQDIEAQAERFRQEYATEKKMLKASRKPSIEFEASSKRKSTPGEISFELKKINVVGMTIIDPQRLSSIWEKDLGTTVTLKEVQDIADKIKALYKEFGFLTSVAYLPPQDIKDGVVEIRVAEGKMGLLHVEGNKWFNASRIGRYFHTYKNGVLNIPIIQKDIMRINEQSDLAVSTVIAAGEEPGTSDIILKVKENFPHHITAGFDNHGTRLTGRYRKTLSANSSNFSGRLDTFNINTINSDSSSGIYMGYRIPVGTHGFKAGIDLGYFQQKLGKEYRPYDITGNSKIINPNITWEGYRSPDVQVMGHSGLRIKDNEKKTAEDKTTDEHLRIPYVAFDLNTMDIYGQTSFSPELSVGTEDFLGASSKDNPLNSRRGVGGPFIKYEHFLGRTQRMPWDSYMQLKTQFQIASSSLTSSEQFQLGGSNSIRGYPEGDYLADMGGNLNMDWIFPMYLIPADWSIRNSDTPLRHQIEPVIFLDVGGGRLNKVLPGELKDKFLAGGGAGLRVHVNRNVFIRLEWADHFGDEPIKGTGPSTFGVSVQVGS